MCKNNSKILKEALELQEQYPNREIKVSVDNELFTDDFSWYDANFLNVCLSLWYNNEDEILTEEDSIKDYLYENKEFEMNLMSENERERELDSTIELMKDSGEILEVILIKVGV